MKLFIAWLRTLVAVECIVKRQSGSDLVVGRNPNRNRQQQRQQNRRPNGQQNRPPQPKNPVTFLPTATNKPAQSPIVDPPTRIPSSNPNPRPPLPGPFCSRLIAKRQIVFANGTQLKLGGTSCSSNTLGVLQSTLFQISSIIASPGDMSTVTKASETTVKVNVVNLDGGFFSDPNSQYYISPQTISSNRVEGHIHITVQQLNTNGNNVVPNPQVFQFFKGVDNPAIDPAQREFVAVIPPNTLTASGLYRICSLSGSFSHQPITSSAQRRGSADDCVRINVV